jgi:aspartate 4-decarboxylase
VLLNGSGFEGPEWSVRVSLANLPDEAYAEIGAQLSAIVHGAFEAWQAQARK